MLLRQCLSLTADRETQTRARWYAAIFQHVGDGLAKDKSDTFVQHLGNRRRKSRGKKPIALLPHSHLVFFLLSLNKSITGALLAMNAVAESSTLLSKYNMLEVGRPVPPSIFPT
jgi:hypothetical protein